MKNTYPPFKLLLISPVIPPSPTGQGIIITRIFQHWAPNEYCLLATASSKKEDNSDGVTKYYLVNQAKKKPFFTISNKYVKKITKAIALIARFPKLLFTLLNIIAKEQVSVIVCCSGDFLAFPAATLVSKITKKPLFLYVFDDYINQWPNNYFRKIAKTIEKSCLNSLSSPTIIATNEFLSEIYTKRYNINCIIIHNGLDANTVIQPQRTLVANKGNVIKVIYTGSIYYAHYDAFLNFIAYMNNTSTHIELHIYTAQDKTHLHDIGIFHERIFYHPYIQHEAVNDVLQTADLLFLPLSFDEKYKDIINTSAPGKMAEYLASGIPVLAHVPHDSFVSWYCHKYECAFVIDEQAISAFEKVFATIQTNPAQANYISNNALQRAHVDFNHASIDKKFKNLFRQDCK